MDEKWFKRRQREVGVTAEDIAKIMGRDRSIVSRIYAEKQRMSLEWAQAFAEALKVDLDIILEKAGSLDKPIARTLNPGFAESDAVPFEGVPTSAHGTSLEKQVSQPKPGIDIWQMKSNSMALNGLLVGDFLLVDSHLSSITAPGDIVVAQQYDWQTGTAKTLVRRHEPPVLVAASTDPDDQRALVVDGNNVVIKGKVTASWREH